MNGFNGWELQNKNNYKAKYFLFTQVQNLGILKKQKSTFIILAFES